MSQINPTAFIERFQQFRNDPYGFVLYSYPWGEAGTFLAAVKGVPPSPDKWQIGVMETLRKELERRDLAPDEVFAAICLAVASGHGVGKTTLVAWLIHWFVCTRAHPQILVTAGTAAQLEKKTWRELAKWHKISLQRQWFEWTATKFYLKEAPETWFAAAIPWSEHNADAFAGTHEKYVLVIFDEASAIADIIWETVEGAMTTAQCIWIAFGNPIRNTGRFKACFTKFRNFWKSFRVDSRTSKVANQAQIAQWAKQYGEDSDFFRKRVKGEFPKMSSNQLVSEETVEACREFVAYGYESFPIRIGVDIAGEGENADDTVIIVAQGHKVHECHRMNGYDPVEVYTKVSNTYDHYQKMNDRLMVYVDKIGIGHGVHALCKKSGMPVIGVISGAQAKEPERYVNLRIEMWYDMAEALKEGIDLTALSDEDYTRLKEDLTNIEYYETTSSKYQLESVDDLKERELPSPDYGSALAFTFAYPVPHIVQSSQNKIKKADAGASTIKRMRGRNGIIQKGR